MYTQLCYKPIQNERARFYPVSAPEGLTDFGISFLIFIACFLSISQ